MLRKIWIELRSSLWFVPGLLVLIAVLVALGLVELDVRFAKELASKAWQPLLNTGAEGARGMLTAIAGSMITVAAMAFSITIVTLSLASTQYTPRILRNFMRDRANQYVLGFFVAIFTYCLIVLRTIRGGGEIDASFVPMLAVAFGLLLALLSIGCLIFFIHHVAASIQASSILQAITSETFAALEKLFPDALDGGKSDADPTGTMPDSEWHPLPAHTNGYIQHIDAGALHDFAREKKAVLRIECAPGEFAAQGAPLLSVSVPLDDEDADALRPAFVIGDFRTVQQDAGFGIRQIVDIALKALSPGVNDTSTAVSCLDYLSAILSRLATRKLVSPFHDDEGTARVVVAASDFGVYVARCFDEIRLCARGNVTIILEMLRAIERVATATRNGPRREALLRHAQFVVEMADHSTPASYDRARVTSAIENMRRSFDADATILPALPPSRHVEPWA